jgi:hypothetical protein
VVAEVDRIRQVLEAEGVLLEAGNREHPRNRAERDHEPLVPDCELLLLGLDGHALSPGVEGRRVTDDEVAARAHHPQRDDDVPRLEGAGGRLGQQRREEHEVLVVDDRRFAAALAQ